MKIYNNEELVQCADLTDNWPVNAADPNQEDEDQDDRDDEEDDNEDEEDDSADWGDVDPAGGPEPSFPGSAV